MKFNGVAILLLSFVMSYSVKAQQIDSLLRVSSDNYQPEKLHIHFDRSIYNKGETIWFKAYLMAGIELSDYSKSIYFDWYDDNGNLLKHIVAPIFESSSRGQFVIPEKYKGQSLHLKAYTSWMQNFDNAFIYNRDIKVYQSWASKKSITKPITTVHLFPEGGNLIEGIISTIAFKAYNQKGLPVRIVKGSVKDITQRSELATFSSIHDGMGSFKVFVPSAKDSIQVSWTDEFGNNGVSSFPKALIHGASISVSRKGDKLSIQVTRSDSAAFRYKNLNLIAHLHQQPFAKATINLNEKTSLAVQIPISELPSGLVEITLFDNNWTPLAERAYFVNNHQYRFTPTINTITKGLGKREKNVFEIEMPDSIQSNMSIAVTDAGVGVDSSYNIFSELLLTGDINGYVHNPAYYFTGVDSTSNYLDLVMMTNGWRRIKWENLQNGKLPNLTNPRDSDYLQIAGNIVGSSKRDKIQSSQMVLLMLQQPNGKTQTITLPVKSDKTFKQSGVFFMDTIKVFYKFFGGDQNIANTSELVLTNGLLKPNPNNISENEMQPYLWMTDTTWIARERFFAEQRLKQDKMDHVVALEDYVIKSRAKKPVDVLDEKYASGLFASGDAYQYDVMNNTYAQSSINVLSYLQGQVPGLMITQQSDGSTTLSWRGNVTELFLDEMRAEPDMLSSIAMGDIAYVKVFRPPFFGSVGGGAGGAVSVYTRKGTDIQSKPGVGLPYKLLEGYTSYKEFYSPDYSVPTSNPSDIRNTIYWNPYLLTDKNNKKIRIEFYNNDISKKFRMVLEGVNLEGKMTRIEKEIN